MRQSTRLILNASANVTGGIVNTAVSLLVVPLILAYIGKETYGVFEVVAGLTLYMPFLHAGMSSAVTRFSAAHLANQEYDEMNAVVNTGVVYYRITAVVFFLGALIFAFFFVNKLVSNHELQRLALVCTLVVGGVEAVGMLFGPVSGLLWAIERFDLSSIAMTSCRLLRLASLAILLPLCDSSAGLIVVTSVMAGTNVLPIAVSRMFASWYCPNLKFSMRLAQRRLLWPMLSFGFASLGWNWAQLLLGYIPVVLISYFLTTKEVAEYAVPARMLLLVNMLVNQILTVMMPAATKLAATDRRDDLRFLFLRTSKYAAGIAFAGSALLGTLAPTVLHLWVGDAFLPVAVILTLLAVGRIALLVQTSSYYLLVGMAKQRFPAIIAVTSVVVMGAGQAIVLGTTDWGLPGVACVATVTLTLGWGVGTALYACRQVGVSVADYYAVTFIRPVLACVPAFAVWLAVRQVPLHYSWLTVVLAVLVGVPLVLAGWWFILFDKWDRQLAVDKLCALRQKLRSLRATRPASAGSLDEADEG
ncbi:MAG: oligosaccharide flippase family protein [Phycisphaerae bacterium]|nr:oligosaccharide flippase family protein [Phycisphaerae bacterium]